MVNVSCHWSSWCMHAALVSNSPELHSCIMPTLQVWYTHNSSAWCTNASCFEMNMSLHYRHHLVLKELSGKSWSLLVLPLQLLAHHAVWSAIGQWWPSWNPGNFPDFSAQAGPVYTKKGCCMKIMKMMLMGEFPTWGVTDCLCCLSACN